MESDIYIFKEITLERSLINYTIPVSIEVRRSKVDTQLRFKVITKYVIASMFIINMPSIAEHWQLQQLMLYNRLADITLVYEK